MNDQAIRDYQMFVRSRDFVSENLSDFPAQSLGRQRFNALEAEIAILEEQGAAEESGANATRIHTQSKRETKKRLRGLMEMISRTARRMAENGQEVTSSFRIPQSNGEQALVNAARAMAADAVPMKNQFIKWELPETFLEDLNAAIEDFEEHVNKKNTSAARRTEANAAIGGARRRGKEAVRGLNQIIINKYKNNPAKLAAWERASHIERAPRASKKESTTGTTVK